jgi:hypothetical protein
MTSRLQLREFCAARSGDKGNSSDVTLFACDAEFYEVLRLGLTVERVVELLEPLRITTVDRYELPALGAVKVVLHDALGGGGSGSLRADNLGKTMGGTLLRLEVDVDDDLAARAPRPRPGALWMSASP